MKPEHAYFQFLIFALLTTGGGTHSSLSQSFVFFPSHVHYLSLPLPLLPSLPPLPPSLLFLPRAKDLCRKQQQQQQQQQQQ